MEKLNSIQQFACIVIPLLFGITLHEVAHGWVALQFGDRTAQMLGRLTVNPIKHIDPIGTILVPIILYIVSNGAFMFGWAKPVPVTWQNLRNPKRDMALVALAGPGANLLMALFWGLIAKVGQLILGSYGTIGTYLVYMGIAGILFNAVLMILNLIPIPPLDGSRVATSLMPDRWGYQYNRLEAYGFFILIALLATGILSKIIILPVLIFIKAVLLIFHIPLSYLFTFLKPHWILAKRNRLGKTIIIPQTTAKIVSINVNNRLQIIV